MSAARPSDDYVADLVRRANQIANQFLSYPEAEAVEETRLHLERFWDPRMRRALAAAAARADSDLDPVARAAARAAGT
ncbi:MAG: formate dehydrogenase subunit delta [Spirochaetaceae bacterium]|nr:formate dehydrogenase subunit delta [Spirochaetaceae bacterium]HPG28600.1 formate dehydrogenase subunit delta [Myxococcota bacterium]